VIIEKKKKRKLKKKKKKNGKLTPRKDEGFQILPAIQIKERLLNPRLT
jgi:hypothetical protein